MVPGWGWSLGEGNGYPLQYSGLENSADREAWWATYICLYFYILVYAFIISFPPPGDLANPWIEPVSHVSCIGRRVLYH